MNLRPHNPSPSPRSHRPNLLSSTCEASSVVYRRRGFAMPCRLGWLCLPIVVTAFTCFVSAQQPRPQAVEARQGLVVSVSPPGSDVGLAILKQGGYAVDAAIATAFALAVTYPAAG